MTRRSPRNLAPDFPRPVSSTSSRSASLRSVPRAGGARCGRGERQRVRAVAPGRGSRAAGRRRARRARCGRRARLVAEEPGEPGRYGFVHAIVRETLAGTLTAARRAHFHDLFARILERRAEHRPGPLSGGARQPRARSRRRAWRSGAGGRARRAGGKPRRRGARATRTRPSSCAGPWPCSSATGGSAARRAELMCALGEALARAGSTEADATLRRANELARAEDRSDLIARVALAKGGTGVTILGADSTLVAELEPCARRGRPHPSGAASAAAGAAGDRARLRARPGPPRVRQRRGPPDRRAPGRPGRAGRRTERAARRAVGTRRHRAAQGACGRDAGARRARRRPRTRAPGPQLAHRRPARARRRAGRARRARRLRRARGRRAPPGLLVVRADVAGHACAARRTDRRTGVALSRRARDLGRQAGDRNADVFFAEHQLATPPRRRTTRRSRPAGSRRRRTRRRALPTRTGMAGIPLHVRVVCTPSAASSSRPAKTSTLRSPTASPASHATSTGSTRWAPQPTPRSCSETASAPSELRTLLEPYADRMIVNARGALHAGSVAYVLARLAAACGRQCGRRPALPARH